MDEESFDWGPVGEIDSPCLAIADGMNALTREALGECNCIDPEEAYEIGRPRRMVDGRIVVQWRTRLGNCPLNNLPLPVAVGIAVVCPVKNQVSNQAVLVRRTVVAGDTAVAKQMTDYTYYTGPFSELVIVVPGPWKNPHCSFSDQHHRPDLQMDHTYYTDSKQVARWVRH